MPSISCIDISYEHPDRTSVFDGLSLTLGPGLSSLVGRNGAGKTTLLRLVAGELAPGSGTVLVDGVLAYVPQDLLASSRGAASGGGGPQMADLLGVRSRLAALARIEAGSADEDDFTVLGDEWDVAERTSAVIAKMGLPAGPGDLFRPAAQLSGGERTLAAVAGA
ncbi:ATP-binding cassette domain-containing protein, partial [Dietzia timorensis]